jgi:Serine/threonine protein kinase
VEMEYIPRSLADMEKPMQVRDAVAIITGIACGLAYAHGKGVIHRDIKPENILIDVDTTPKITDWGMSRILASQMPTVVGFSVSYAAPEQISPSQFGLTDERTDIFQLGVVFYELVTGMRPFVGEDSGEIMNAILHTDPLPPSSHISTTKSIEPIILTCIAKNPEDRYPSVTDLLADLQRMNARDSLTGSACRNGP